MDGARKPRVFCAQELILAILNHLRNFFTRAFSPLMYKVYQQKRAKIRERVSPTGGFTPCAPLRGGIFKTTVRA